jgi:hypothetical protein
LRLSDDELAAHDIIADLVSNESAAADQLVGLGDAGEFWITIMRFGPLYWIDAADFVGSDTSRRLKEPKALQR